MQFQENDSQGPRILEKIMGQPEQLMDIHATHIS